MITFNYVVMNPLNPMPLHCFSCRRTLRMLSKIAIKPDDEGINYEIYLCRECLDTLTRTVKVKLEIDEYKE